MITIKTSGRDSRSNGSKRIKIAEEESAGETTDSSPRRMLNCPVQTLHAGSIRSDPLGGRLLTQIVKYGGNNV